ncbi:MAG: VCBS repeat-containing protein [Bryobacter sp.]|nr:VCBS repeat-containing protein [Bryobacter sp.]
MKAWMAAALLGLAGSAAPGQTPATSPGWVHLSTPSPQLPLPNTGTQQTSATVFDIDRDGRNDFVITERTKTPPVTWFRRGAEGWTRYVVENEFLKPEAGSTFGDVDGDGDLDFLSGADGGGETANQVWWWENPAPRFDPNVPWKRHTIKQSGGRKHHDLLWADVDHDGRSELVFWNQGARRLLMAKVPSDPRQPGEWPLSEIYSYSSDSEQQQRASAPPFKSINEHEGLAFVDIDLDGKSDIVGGGLWFKHAGGAKFIPNEIDGSYHFSRSAAGQLIEGGRPEVVLVVGDGVGPLLLYEWQKGTWKGRTVVERIDNGHSLALVDFDGDGRLDIFCAEMRLNGGNLEAKAYLLLGDGKGSFRTTVAATGFDNHESKIADLDGDGTLDILGKPYNHQTPALHIWLNPKGARVVR